MRFHCYVVDGPHAEQMVEVYGTAPPLRLDMPTEADGGHYLLDDDTLAESNVTYAVISYEYRGHSLDRMHDGQFVHGYGLPEALRSDDE